MSLQLSGLSELTEVGRGTYGIVYRARQESLRRFVAVKVLAAKLDEEAASRFTQECRALGALSGHPNIVAVHDAGTTAEGEPYLVMPFCERGSLADRLGRGPLPWQEVLDIGVRLAGALQTAHEAGILHRDLKPANVLVDSFANPQLADFGQSRHADSELTGTGTVVGTPSYAAPELLSGGTASPASDVHSLAATLVALITGRGPYSLQVGENVAAVMYRVVNEPPADLRPHGVPDALCEVIEWGLDKDPAQRPPTAAVFGKAMQGLQRRVGLPVTALAAPGEQPPTNPPRVDLPDARTAATPTAHTVRTPPPAGPPIPAAPPSRVAFPSPPVDWPTQGSGTRVRRRWLVAGAAVVVVAIAATLLFVLGDGDEPPSANPGQLLLAADDYGMSGLHTDSQMKSAFQPLFGEPGAMRETDLANCLGLPVNEVLGWNSSAVYTDGTPIGEADDRRATFAAAQSAGLVMSDAAAARSVVDSWTGARFDTCRDLLLAAGIALVSGQESPVVDQIEYQDLPAAGKLPGSTHYAGKRIDVPLRASATGETSHLFVDVEVMAADRYVVMALTQHFPEPASPDVQRAVTKSMVDKVNSAR